MSRKTIEHKSSNGNKYEIHGSNFAGWSATDKSTGEKSVYNSETTDGIKSHIEACESGATSDVKGFADAQQSYSDYLLNH